MKKTAIALGIIIFGSIMFFPAIAAYSGKTAFEAENHNKAPGTMAADHDGKINMRFSRYDTGRRVTGQTAKAFPNENWMGDAYYQIAKYYEQSGHSEKAVDRYNLFMEKFPAHPWNKRAAKRIVDIKANL